MTMTKTQETLQRCDRILAQLRKNNEGLYPAERVRLDIAPHPTLAEAFHCLRADTARAIERAATLAGLQDPACMRDWSKLDREYYPDGVLAISVDVTLPAVKCNDDRNTQWRTLHAFAKKLSGRTHLVHRIDFPPTCENR